MKRLADKLAWLFFLVPPTASGLIFLLEAYGIQDLPRLVVYILFAIAATVLAIGHIRLLFWSKDGKASIWLMAFAYSKVYLAIALWGISVVVLIRLWYPTLITSTLLHAVYALITSAAVGTMLSAIVFALGYKFGCLSYRVQIFPWSRKKKEERKD